MDKLPERLRHELAFASRVYDATELLPLYERARRSNGQGSAIDWLVASIHHNDEQDVMPCHRAARATILRFHLVERRTRGMSVRGCDVARRVALASSAKLLPR